MRINFLYNHRSRFHWGTACPTQYWEREGSYKHKKLCLFTCATTHAIHLEVVTDLSTKTFLLAFQRFVNQNHYLRLSYLTMPPHISQLPKNLKPYHNW